MTAEREREIVSAADIPVVMCAPMVRACLYEVEQPGKGKRNTRRLAWSTKPPKSYRLAGNETYRRATTWQNVKPGDRLWVRERLSRSHSDWRYEADKRLVQLDRGHPRVSTMIAWAHHYERDYCPSIHMPRWASRLTLVVSAVKTERLQDISEADAIAEGVNCISMADVKRQAAWSARGDFAQLWNFLHGAGAWEANPEVVAIRFDVRACNIDTLKEAA